MTADRVVVQKFGGSSVATPEKLRAVAQKIVDTRRAGFGVVVVVSAMGNTTDELLTLARQMSHDPSRRELDMLLSVGERISMSLLSIAIHDLGEKAISFTGSQCGIVTTDAHANARIIDVRPFRVQDELDRGHIVIVAGFQGTSYKREITTLGRGGSDTTAVALAAALGAEHCDIFSDVDGVYTADPRVVASAQRLDEISYEEMQELARQGARVLNAQAVEFARRNRIAIWARSTFGEAGGTKIYRVDGFPQGHAGALRTLGVRGVASARSRLHLRASGVAMESLADRLGDVELVASAWDAVAERFDAVIACDNAGPPAELARRLSPSLGAGGTASAEVGTASVVGLGVGGDPRVLRRAIDTLRTASISPRAVFGARESVTCVVDAAQTDDAVRALHAAFLDLPETSPTPIPA